MRYSHGRSDKAQPSKACQIALNKLYIKPNTINAARTGSQAAQQAVTGMHKQWGRAQAVMLPTCPAGAGLAW